MGDIPGGWAVVIAGLFASLPGVVAAVMSVRTRTAVRRVGHDTALVKEQVKNSHPKNLREEQDDRHDVLMTELGSIRSAQTAQGRDIGGIKADIRGLRTDQSELARQLSTERDRIHDLEKTHPRIPRSRNGNENDDQH